jgi:hypothetical protein
MQHTADTTLIPEPPINAGAPLEASSLVLVDLAAAAGRTGADDARANAPASAPAGQLRGVYSGPALLSIHEHKSSPTCQIKTYDSKKAVSEIVAESDERTSIDRLPERLERYHKAKIRQAQMSAYLHDLSTSEIWTADALEAIRLARAGRAPFDRFAGSDTASKIRPAEMLRRSETLSTCGSYLHFRYYFTADRVALHAAQFCQQPKLCPMCAIRRAARLLRRLVERFMTVHHDKPQLIPVLATMTVKNGEHLGERFKHLRCSLDKLNHRAKHARTGKKNLGSVMARVAGGYWSIEVKRGEGDRGGGWHPHCHAVWLCDSLPAVDDLRAEWKEITGDSHMCDVRPFNFYKRGLAPTADNIGADFAEVTKYALKFSTMDPADNWHAFDTLRGAMMARPFGVLHGVKEEPAGPDDFDPADLPYYDMLFNHSATGYRQVFSSPPA